MLKLKETLMLTDKGYQNLKKGIFACALTNFSMMIPMMVIVQILMEIIKPLMGESISWGKIGIYFGFGFIGAFLVFFASKNDYKKTYVNSYLEAEHTRVSIAEQVRKLPMSVFNSKNLSELATGIMGDVAITEQVLSHIYPQILANAITVTVICVMLAIYDWRMAVSVFFMVPLAFFIIFISRKLQRKLGESHNVAKLDASDKVQEYLEGIKVIKACNLDGDKFTALEKALRNMRNLAVKLEAIAGVFVSGAQAVLQVGVGVTIFVGIQLLTSSQIDFIPMFMFLLVVTKIYGPIIVELTLLPQLFYHQIAIGRLRTLMGIEVMQGEAIKLQKLNISFDHVNFRYNESGEEVIKDLTTQIEANSITAIVGPSGSGKSTLSRLIARFWDTNSGTVSIGGRDVKTLEPEHLMSYMSFVFQDVTLFHDTVYNNIKIGNMNATKEQVLEAAKAARCEEFILGLPEGYETILGENGSTLSGGERQRLSIARALLKDAPIILLDEVTASLDPENEIEIQEAIAQLIEGKIVVVIAHRLRTIAEADKIIVLDEGQLEEEGTHQELMEKKGLYHKLYTIQKESMGWSV